MKAPDKPDDETARLEALHMLEVLDTPFEERFDRLTRLAKRMFNVPIALVSLVDMNRQWFKSCNGLNVQETPRDISFCGHSILGDDVFVIPDTLEDDRFADNPLVTNDPNIRFYAGSPLKHMNGHKLGTLCIIDSVPRELSDEDKESLEDLTELVERELAAYQLATVDVLTQISNRSGFTLLAKRSLSICERQKIPATVVFLDLNNFKTINDTFGHAEGDKALSVFANFMKTTFRNSDVFARFGGDEFVVLLTNARQTHTQEIITRLGNALDQYNQEAQRGYDIAFSAGIVTVEPGDDYDIDRLLKAADKKMYKKKLDAVLI